MTETLSQQSSALHISCPPESLNAPSAETSSCVELQENRDMEKNGVLTNEMVSDSVSQPGRFGTGLQHMCHNLSLPSRNLCDTSVLCHYVHLQKLELPHNKIKDLSCVSHMPHLVFLDASHNEISNFFEFHPPKNLQEVDLSHNHMTTMKDLAAYASLCKLNLDYNKFSEISGLQQCCRLTHLTLAHNRISRINSLDGLPLTQLCLRGNQLERIEGLENVKCLQVLDLSLNRITSLSGLQNLHLLGSINLEKNQINEIQECKHIHDLLLLRDLNLFGNPVQEQPDYRLAVVFLLQHLTMLDQKKVTAEEKVASVNKYDPPLDLVAFRDNMTLLLYQLMQPQVLYDSTLPSADSPYPVLVLTGPQGCGKRELVHRLCQEFSEYFGYGICHTTREPYYGEENGIDYHFVSEEDFQNMVHMGKFIQTMHFGGHQFGLTRDVIEDLAREGLACCLHTELEGVFGFRRSYFEPRCIMLIPAQVEKFIGHLKSRGLSTSAQIDVAVSRIELYADTNKQRLGFFDNVIPCDELEEAFQILRQVVKEYLLLEEEEEEKGENNSSTSLDSTSTGHDPEEKPPSAVLGSDSASALEPSDSSCRPYLTKIQAELSPQKTSAEQASIRRREQLVRDAIVGRSPGVYSQLFKSFTQTAPSSLSNQNPGTHFHEDTSLNESRVSSALSIPSSVGAFMEPLDIPVLGHTLETLKDHMASGQRSDEPYPGTDHLAIVKSPSSDRRPGSNVELVLPPIPTGRKTPAAPSPPYSPRLSPNQGKGRGC